MALRAQLGAMRGIVATHLDAALTREFGVQMVAREDGAGNEIEGISREHDRAVFDAHAGGQG